MATFAPRGTHIHRIGYDQTDRTPIADPTTVTYVDPVLPRMFVGVRLYDAETGGNQIAGTAGTFKVEVMTETTNYWYELPGVTIAANNPGQDVTFSGNVKQVRVTPQSVSGNGVTHYSVHVTQNRE